MTVTTAPPPRQRRRRRTGPRRLTSGRLPGWAPWAILVGSLGSRLARLRRPRDRGRRPSSTSRAGGRHGDPLPRADHRHLERWSRAAARRVDRLVTGIVACGIPHRDGAAGLGRLDRHRQRCRRALGRVLHQLDAQRRRRGRRRAPRDRRHRPHHPRCRRHLHPDRALHRDLPRRVRRGATGWPAASRSSST